MDKKYSLEELDKSIQTNDNFDSYVVKRCNELIKVPLEELSIEDLRILIGQQMGLKFLIDLAIEKISTNILAEGDLYPGDLLNSILSVDNKYWMENEKQWIIIDTLIKQNQNELDDIKLKTEIFYVGISNNKKA